MVSKDSKLTGAQEKILNIVSELVAASPQQLLDWPEIGVGRVMLHRHLKALLDKGRIERIGLPPKVYYQVVSPTQNSPEAELVWSLPVGDEARLLLEQWFAYADVSDAYFGVEGFRRWYLAKQLPTLTRMKSKETPLAERIRPNFDLFLSQYIAMRTEIEKQRTSSANLLDATDRYKSIFPNPEIDRVYYQDFYSLPQFGKTKLGVLVQKAKIGDAHSLTFIKAVCDEIKEAIHALSEIPTDAFLWVPHSLKRQYGLMDKLADQFGDKLPKIRMQKIFKKEIIPQKTLSELDQRIANATLTNHILESKQSLAALNHICIVDDAIGSNATIHGIAKKIHALNPNIKITAFGLVGSYKGFDVIRDI